MRMNPERLSTDNFRSDIYNKETAPRFKNDESRGRFLKPKSGISVKCYLTIFFLPDEEM